MPNLFNETGHTSQDDRNSEAIRLMEELLDYYELMPQKERTFVEDMNKRKEQGNLFCTGKQLFWLRDLYEKYCL